MAKFEATDLTGQQFGRLQVLYRYKAKYARFAYWLCECTCGQQIVVRSDNLRSGHTKSCGCSRRRTNDV